MDIRGFGWRPSICMHTHLHVHIYLLAYRMIQQRIEFTGSHFKEEPTHDGCIYWVQM